MHDSVFLLVECSSWSLSGLAMQPIYQSYQQQQFTARRDRQFPKFFRKVTNQIIYVLGDEPQLYRHERTALITVKDSGIGIPRKTGGTGLGLAIAKGMYSITKVSSRLKVNSVKVVYSGFNYDAIKLLPFQDHHILNVPKRLMLYWLHNKREKRFELSTFSLARRRSTTELHPHFVVNYYYTPIRYCQHRLQIPLGRVHNLS